MKNKFFFIVLHLDCFILNLFDVTKIRCTRTVCETTIKAHIKKFVAEKMNHQNID